MERNADRSIAQTLKLEGGYVNNKDDDGGPTNRGITLANFKRFVKPGATIADLKAMTLDQAAAVYRKQFWNPILASSLPDGVDFAVYDFHVMSGQAVKIFQRVIGVQADGVVGPETVAAAQKIAPAVLITNLSDARLKYYQGLGDWKHFGAGWKSRVDQAKAFAMSLADQPNDAPVVQVQHIETETPVPTVPKGADKPAKLRWLASVPLLGTPLAAFADLDFPSKVLIVGLALAAVIAMLWFGELIAHRAKKIFAAFSDGPDEAPALTTRDVAKPPVM